MQATDMQGILADEDTIQRRQEALRSLLIRRTTVLRESLKQRMRRARNNGEWIETLARGMHRPVSGGTNALTITNRRITG